MFAHATALLRSTAHYAFPRTSMRLIGSRDRHDEIELSFLPALVDADRDAIDVGANVGRYALPLARIARHVHVFEPHPRLARMMRIALPRNTSVHQMAVSDSEGLTTLHIPIAAGRQDEGLAFVDGRPEYCHCRTLKVVTTTLDSLAERDVGFVKIDVEGHELNVLQGSCRLISDCRPTFLVEAEDRHQPGAVGKVAAFFAARGYRGIFVCDHRVHDVTSFTPAMQDIALLARFPPGTARRDIPYVNNFLFIPVDRNTRDIIERIDWILRHASFAQSKGSASDSSMGGLI